MFLRKMLHPDKMEELEQWLLDCGPASGLSEEELSRQLRLKVEYVSPEVLGPYTEAELRPIEDNNYNGLIRVNVKEQGKSFPYLHEIMHYLKDVGKGNRVEQVFTRKIKGKTENEHEQEINYTAAAYRMPYVEIERALKDYDSSSPKMDELVFVDRLSKQYDQGHEAVIRRIREVRTLKKKRGARR